MRYILLTLIVLAAAGTLRAQDEQPSDTLPAGPNLHLIARSYGDSVVLRWGTSTHTAWKVANSGGYVVQRFEIRRDADGTPMQLTPSTIKPLTIEEWKARYSPEDTLAGAAVQSLYGQAIVTSDDPFGSIYEMYLQQQNLHGFALLLADMEPRLADGLGLRFVDRSFTKGRTYLYRVYSPASNPDEPIDTAFVVVTTGTIDSTRSVQSLTADEGELQVALKWNRYEHEVPFSGYFIEKSNDGGRTFSRINRLPFIPAVDTDSDDAQSDEEITYTVPVEANYRPVTYRIVGVDAFGETSPRSMRVVAMGRDRTPPNPPQVLPIAIVDGRSVRMAWSVDSVEADLAGFQIARSEDIDGYFKPVGPLLSRETRQFVDADRRDLPQHYYIVSAIDTAGNLRSSVPLLAMFPDSMPPAVPMALKGTIDSNGIVLLSWNANEEADLQGYRVFYANQTDHEFQQLTTDITMDTTFSDTLTLETLSEEIYYRITALDNNFNHSEFTATLTLKKPDIVSPAPPLVIAITPAERGVEIGWHRSPSGDVAEHMLYRREVGDSTWQVIARSADSTFVAHTDSTASSGVIYEYSLDARDDDGRTSLRSNIVTATRLVSGSRPEIDGLTHTLDRTAGTIVLRWRAPSDRTARIYLYKSTAEGDLSLLQSIEGSTAQFSDAEIASGGSYRYGLKVVTDDGRESRMVTTEQIRYE